MAMMKNLIRFTHDDMLENFSSRAFRSLRTLRRGTQDGMVPALACNVTYTRESAMENYTADCRHAHTFQPHATTTELNLYKVSVWDIISHRHLR